MKQSKFNQELITILETMEYEYRRKKQLKKNLYNYLQN